MRDPIKRRLGDNFVEIYAWGAAPYIKEALKLNANVWVELPIEVPGCKIVLSHTAANRPVGKLPWPLSAIQPHDVIVTFIFSDELKAKNPELIDESKVNKWETIDEVIKEALGSVPSETVITISVS